MGAEGKPPLGFHPAAAGADAVDRRFEVVVTDVTGRNSAQHVERLHVSFHEGLLGPRSVNAVDGLAGIRQPQREQVALDDLARQADPHIGEVHLRFLAGQMHLRDHARQVPTAAGSRTVALGAGFFLGGGTAEVSACRTVRRCTPYFSASARCDISGSRRLSRRIAANSSVRDNPIPASRQDRDQVTRPPT